MFIWTAPGSVDRLRIDRGLDQYLYYPLSAVKKVSHDEFLDGK